ncbi:MAG: hypothetical protein BroJett011_75030 [Chloroflexota bacterium]|nr:MAG: hypothetical protein BroJett011_75030 [Chloroflexota bacterium]
MAPEVFLRKLTYLRQILADLAPFQGASLAQVEAEHYKLERILELLVMAASDILHHLLAERGITPSSYRETFKLAAEQGLVPADLAARLQDAASMRNVIVHLYEQINYSILRDSITPALEDFKQFVALFETELDDKTP